MKSERSQVGSHNQKLDSRPDSRPDHWPDVRSLLADRISRGPYPGFDWQLPDGPAAASLPAVPALFATRLQLELLLQNPVIDLRAVTEVILGDLGATIEVLRLAAREREPGEEMPARIEDALAGLPLESCLQAVSGAAFAHDGRFAALAAAWEHAREVARSMRAAAERDGSVRPEQAYLVGLLHELAQLPALLGWPGAGGTEGGGIYEPRTARPRQTKVAGIADGLGGSLLAEGWGLPSFLIAALWELECGRRSSPWVSRLDAAHGRNLESHPAPPSAAPPSRRMQAPGRKSRVLPFASFEQQQWKTRAALPQESSPMRPPA